MNKKEKLRRKEIVIRFLKHSLTEEEIKHYNLFLSFNKISKDEYYDEETIKRIVLSASSSYFTDSEYYALYSYLMEGKDITR